MLSGWCPGMDDSGSCTGSPIFVEACWQEWDELGMSPGILPRMASGSPVVSVTPGLTPFFLLSWGLWSCPSGLCHSLFGLPLFCDNFSAQTGNIGYDTLFLFYECNTLQYSLKRTNCLKGKHILISKLSESAYAKS